jgi:hypothetical protein
VLQGTGYPSAPRESDGVFGSLTSSGVGSTLLGVASIQSVVFRDFSPLLEMSKRLLTNKSHAIVLRF